MGYMKITVSDMYAEVYNTDSQIVSGMSKSMNIGFIFVQETNIEVTNLCFNFTLLCYEPTF